METKKIAIATLIILAFGAAGYYLYTQNNNSKSKNSLVAVTSSPTPPISKSSDSDKDGLSDVIEKVLGSNINNADTDSDTYSDLDEIKNGYSPLIAGSTKLLPEEWQVLKDKIKAVDKEFYERNFEILPTSFQVSNPTSSSISTSFICGMTTVKDVDNNIYNTVKIGEQCWLKQNLKVTKNPEGKTIDRDCYNNDPDICNTDGGLYTWLAAMNIIISNIQTFESFIQAKEPAQGICPDGWHIPRDSEWSTLEIYLEENKAKTADGSFMSCSGADGYWIGCGSAGTKLRQGGSSGFEAVYAGSVENTHSPIALPNEFWYKEYLYKSNWEDTDRASKFNSRGESAYFWSSTSLSPRIPQGYSNTRLYEAWFRKLSSVHGGTLKDDAVKNRGGMSVRCLKD